MSKRLVAALAVLALATAAPLAQQPGSEPKPAAPAAAAPSGPPKPTAELKKLDVFRGKWTSKETFFPSEWTPNGGTGEGTANTIRALDARFLYQSYKSQGVNGPFEGIGMVTYDMEKKIYRSWWFDSWGSAEVMEGGWEGDKLVLSGESSFMGKKYRNRTTYHSISADAYTMTAESAPEGGELKKVMELVYSKIK